MRKRIKYILTDVKNVEPIYYSIPKVCYNEYYMEL
jgi:hypothetical protein